MVTSYNAAFMAEFSISDRELRNICTYVSAVFLTEDVNKKHIECLIYAALDLHQTNLSKSRHIKFTEGLGFLRGAKEGP